LQAAPGRKHKGPYVLIALGLGVAAPARGQQSPTIHPPPGSSGHIVLLPPGSGEPSTYVMLTPGGGYTIMQFGKPSTSVLPALGSAARQVPFSPLAPCCLGMPLP
jgi:hypothetical protein